MPELKVINGVEIAIMDGALEFALRVIPGAGSSVIVGAHGGALKVRVSAAPEKGKANKAVINLLEKSLGIKRGAASIVSGETSKDKRVRLDGVLLESIADKLLGTR